MKHTAKHDAGFTLVELVVAMAMAVIVTAAATSVLLMGLRINRQTADTAIQQITVRSLLSIVEEAAADGNIQGVISDYESWQLIDTAISKDAVKPSYRVIFGFDSKTQTIYTGRVITDGEITTPGTAVLEGVYASNAIIEDKLLSVSVETKEGIFATSTYCRTTKLEGDSDTENLPGDTDDAATNKRSKFIEALKSQYRSRGEIKGTNTYYSQWYLGGEYSNGWNTNTPWCACYVSWALNGMGFDVKQPDSRKDTDKTGNTYYKWFANVDEFILYFTSDKYGADGQSWFDRGVKSPEPGDLIFFDWDKGTNPEHVGVVLKVTDHMVYTIEGNSAGRVAIRTYSLTDERIIGYGVLPWA